MGSEKDAAKLNFFIRTANKFKNQPQQADDYIKMNKDGKESNADLKEKEKANKSRSRSRRK
jgi:hypothetical protein